MNMYEIRSIELKKVPGNNFIEFLRIEIPERKGYGPIPFARVRYALNGDQKEQENGLPMDLGKGIFTATLEDEELEELGDISREELEKILRKAAIQIVKIVREKVDTPSILKSILKDYPYLKYDECYSEPPDVLKCRVADPKTPRQAEDIFEIERRLRSATGEKYIVTYGGSAKDDDNFDKVWTRFSLRRSDFSKTKSNGV
ncbi:hypothetical protein F4Y93_13245 [Candidatus Poribacteria bacterium]|nr:hypothetical protein [Candidatus Poribacteria bacterium]